MGYDLATAPVTHPRPGEPIMETIDRLPLGLRSCVHDFGFSVVHQFVMQGITSPKTIRHLILTVWGGAREVGNCRQPDRYAGQGIVAQIDDTLSVHGAPLLGRQVMALLRQKGNTLLSTEPTDEMVIASCSALSDRGTVTYEQKHRLRLRAALRRGDQDRWGWLSA